MSGIDTRPSFTAYYLEMAETAALRANCLRRRVGAIITVNNQIVSTGYNGTPFGHPNCEDGGCARCRSDAPSQANYDTCLCVHAEANAVILAARYGVAVRQGTLYTLLRPCFSCLKLLIQAGIISVTFRADFPYSDPALEAEYGRLIRRSDILFFQHDQTKGVRPYRLPREEER